MACIRALHRIALGASLMLALLVLAPGVVAAHPGHAHVGQGVDALASLPGIGTDDALAAISLPDELDGEAASKVAQADAPPASPDGNSASCNAGCCSGSMSCCVLWLAPQVFSSPDFRGLKPAIADIEGAGLDPGALSKPPRALV